MALNGQGSSLCALLAAALVSGSASAEPLRAGMTTRLQDHGDAPWRGIVHGPRCEVAIEGLWAGKIGVVELFVTFGANATGERIAYFDVPVQGVRGLESSPIELSENRLTLQVPTIGAQYFATLHGSQIIGEWQHGPSSHVLILTRQ